MNDIEASCRLDETRLSQRDYTLSLIRQACRQGLLTEEEVRDMKRQLLELVAERTEAWNHGESSSVRIEQAQDFLESILFVMGLQLKAESSADRALETLKTEPVRICFEKGMERVKRKIAISSGKLLRQALTVFSGCTIRRLQPTIFTSRRTIHSVSAGRSCRASNSSSSISAAERRKIFFSVLLIRTEWTG